ncbi:MAG TPA: hypothetical protein PKA85_10875 [Ferruginibacter sp.]|nr:hypothetical protein [Ferruginibacter sp.]
MENNFKKILLCLAASILSFQPSICQNTPSFLEEVPNVLPQSPDAFNFTKYGSLPIGLNTGTAQYNIPVYNITSGKLSHSLSLNYSTNGVKVDEMSTRVGMNWNLKAGGVITRTVMDLPDEAPGVNPVFFHGPLVWGDWGNSTIDSDNNIFIFDPLVWDFYNYVRQSDYSTPPDYQPDEYSYNVDGYSGKFIKRENGEFTEFVFTGMKIEKIGNGFVLTAPNGNKYHFYELEFTNHKGSPENTQLKWIPQSVPTSWMLTKIEDAFEIDEITFDYLSLQTGNAEPITYFNGVSQEFNTTELSGTWTISNSENGNPTSTYYGISTPLEGAIAGVCQGAPLGIFTNVLSTENTTKLLKTINFKSGKIEFNYDEREDVIGEKALKQVVLSNTYNNTVIKKWELLHQYSNYQSDNFDLYNFPNTNFTFQHPELRKRLFLTEFHEVSIDDNDRVKHKFEYEDINALPPRLTFAQDRYGYFNGKQNQYFFPNDTWFDYYLGSIFFGGDRTYDFNYAKKGVLKKIIYPTGGFTTIEYEPHKTHRNYAFKNVFNSVSVLVDTSTSSNQVFYSDPLYYDGQRILQVKGSCDWASVAPNFTTQGGGYTDLEEDYFIKIDLVDASSGVCSPYCNQVIFPGNDFYEGQVSYFEGYGMFNFSVPSGTYKLKITANRKSLKGNFILQTVRKESDRSELSGIAGVRVKKITDFSANNSQSQSKEYLYRNWGDESSSTGAGLLLDDGSNRNNVGMTLGEAAGDSPSGRNFMGCGYNTINSNSVNTNFLTDNGTVLYSKVIELNTNGIENSGGIEYEFYNEEKKKSIPMTFNWGTRVWDIWPLVPDGAPLMNNDMLTGKLKKTTVFKYDVIDGNRTTVKMTENNYTESTSLQIIDTFKVSKRVMSSLFVPEWPNFAAFMIYRYWRYFDYLRLENTIETTFTDDGSITTMVSYPSYSTNNFHPKEILTLNSKGIYEKVSKLYSGDVYTGYPNLSTLMNLKNKNILDFVVEETNSTNNVEKLKKRAEFQIDPVTNLCLPYKAYTSILQTTEVQQMEYQQYDDKGNILQYTAKDGVVHSFIWGYNKQYPVAHITGVNYNTASALVNLSVLNSASTTEQDMRLELDKLHTGITGQHTQVSTYTYIPLVGIKTVKDVNNKLVTYEYDNFYRLKLVRDQDGNILSAQEYQYAQ